VIPDKKTRDSWRPFCDLPSMRLNNTLRLALDAIDELEAQRDELLKALRIAEVHVGWDDCSLENVHVIARKAIANAQQKEPPTVRQHKGELL